MTTHRTPGKTRQPAGLAGREGTGYPRPHADVADNCLTTRSEPRTVVYVFGDLGTGGCRGEGRGGLCGACWGAV